MRSGTKECDILERYFMVHKSISNPFEKRAQSSQQDPVKIAENLLHIEGARIKRRLLRGAGRVQEGADDAEGVNIILSVEEQRLKEERWLRSGEFMLKLFAGHKSPTEEQILSKTPQGFGFTDCFTLFVHNLPFERFKFTEEHLRKLGIVDPEIRRALLRIDQIDERPVRAKIISLEELMEAKQKIDKTKYLSREVIYKTMKSFGYRPATYKELLSFAKSTWKPDVGLELSLEEQDQRIDAGDILALGSCLDVDDYPAFAHLETRSKGGARILAYHFPAAAWPPQCHFLFIREQA